MRKYIALVIIGIVVTLSLSTFYVTNGQLLKNYPRFKLTTEAGDAKLAENLTIRGDFYTNIFDQSLDISKEGTVYQQEKSYFEYLDENFYSVSLEGLQEKYRSFMRGKMNATAESFAENESVLAYADSVYRPFKASVEEYIKLEVLDKDTKKVTKYKVPITDTQNLESVSVEGVKVNEDNIIFIVNNGFFSAGEDDSYRQEYWIYDVDRNNGQINEAELIDVETDLSGEFDYTYNYVAINRDTTKNDIAVAEIGYKYHYSEKDDIETIEEQVINLFTYDIATKELQEIPVTDAQLGDLIGLTGDVAHFVFNDDQQLKFTNYDMTKQEIIKQLPLNEIGENYFIDVQSNRQLLNDGNLFYVAPLEINLQDDNIKEKLYMIELSTLEIVYEGRFELENMETNFKGIVGNDDSIPLYINNVGKK